MIFLNKRSLSQSESVIKYNFIYGLVIILICLLVNASIRLDFYFLKGIPEISFTETLQAIALLLIVICFKQAMRFEHIRAGSFLVGGFFSVLLIRENDFWFDKIFHGFWAYPALCLSLFTVFIFIKAKRKSISQFRRLLQFQAMNKVIIGTILLIIFSRIFGTGSFWQSVTINDSFIVKTIIQEGLELLCYCLIAIGAYEVLQEAKKTFVERLNQ